MVKIKLNTFVFSFFFSSYFSEFSYVFCTSLSLALQEGFPNSSAAAIVRLVLSSVSKNNNCVYFQISLIFFFLITFYFKISFKSPETSFQPFFLTQYYSPIKIKRLLSFKGHSIAMHQTIFKGKADLKYIFSHEFG